MKAFVTNVRPKLEYNTSVWFPHLKSNIKSIESVQKVSLEGPVFIVTFLFLLTVIVCMNLI